MRLIKRMIRWCRSKLGDIFYWLYRFVRPRVEEVPLDMDAEELLYYIEDDL